MDRVACGEMCVSGPRPLNRPAAGPSRVRLPHRGSWPCSARRPRPVDAKARDADSEGGAFAN